MYTLYIKASPGNEDVVSEFYENHGTFHEGDAGLDLFCITEQVIPANSHSVKIKLGIQCCMKYTETTNRKIIDWHGNSTQTSKTSTVSYELFPRSSTGSKTPLRLSNSIGLFDAGYRGEAMAVVDNLSNTDFYIHKGDRFFQFVSPTRETITPQLTDTLPESSRGEGGFGSTN